MLLTQSTPLQIRTASHSTLQELNAIAQNFLRHLPTLEPGLGSEILYLALHLDLSIIPQIDTTYTVGARIKHMLENINSCCVRISRLGVTHVGDPMSRLERRVIEKEMWILKGLLYSWFGSWKRKVLTVRDADTVKDVVN